MKKIGDEKFRDTVPSTMEGGKVEQMLTLYFPQSTQSAGPVRFLIFCLISIILLASPVAGRRPQYSAGAD
jgi:predicted amino acid dehydrogenase